VVAPYEGSVVLAIYDVSSAPCGGQTEAQTAPLDPPTYLWKETHGFELRDGVWCWTSAVMEDGNSGWGGLYNVGISRTYPGP
jgi:hypothetical protein